MDIGSLLGLLVVIGLVILAYGHCIAFEEKTMKNQFGNAYVSYCKETRMLFPFFF
ncbi:MAG: hypothetical protein LKE40_14110 [Spirochaetia bacterium]|jgi:protein-S-isoprenylcysteine O-methyltransferase Ste14|nr:hypothetical protein [Spirochaetia bacterium]